jgi:hypothetical protein
MHSDSKTAFTSVLCVAVVAAGLFAASMSFSRVLAEVVVRTLIVTQCAV